MQSDELRSLIGQQVRRSWIAQAARMVRLMTVEWNRWDFFPRCSFNFENTANDSRLCVVLVRHFQDMLVKSEPISDSEDQDVMTHLHGRWQREDLGELLIDVDEFAAHP